MQLPQWLMQAFLAIWIVMVGIAYLTGASPVLGLIGIIVITTSILVQRAFRKAS